MMKWLIFAAVLIQFTGCDLQNNDARISGADTEKRGLKMPDVIRNATALNQKNIEGYVVVDGTTERPLIINSTGTEFSLTIPNLSSAEHTFRIRFKYNHADFGVIDLTTSDLVTKTLVAGNNVFSDTDFNKYTDANDNNFGQTNIQELSSPIQKDPKRCVLGASKLQDLTVNPPIEGCRLEIVASTSVPPI